ncbi:hypothetical protein CKO51_16245 [Rhodopirellula sp. SM50]|nr:hypothetical protein CKO51_16245 [Rhodopirellula sp. SM50]
MNHASLGEGAQQPREPSWVVQPEAADWEAASDRMMRWKEPRASSDVCPTILAPIVGIERDQIVFGVRTADVDAPMRRDLNRRREGGSSVANRFEG